MIAPISSFATPALSGIAARGFTAMRMGNAEYKPWDVKQEGGQMDSGWGTGEISIFESRVDYGLKRWLSLACCKIENDLPVVLQYNNYIGLTRLVVFNFVQILIPLHY